MSTKRPAPWKAQKKLGGTDQLTGNIILLSSSQLHLGDETRYYLLPADAASYDKQVEAMVKNFEPNFEGGFCESDARSALAAIGITRPKPSNALVSGKINHLKIPLRFITKTKASK